MVANSLGLRNMQSHPATPDSRKRASGLTSSAQQFESMLLGQWLADAESSFGSTPGGDGDQDSGGEQMKDFGVRQLAGQLTAQGGIGIARIVTEGLVNAAGHKAAGNASPEAAGRTGAPGIADSAALAYSAEAAQ